MQNIAIRNITIDELDERTRKIINFQQAQAKRQLEKERKLFPFIIIRADPARTIRWPEARKRQQVLISRLQQEQSMESTIASSSCSREEMDMPTTEHRFIQRLKPLVSSEEFL